MSGAFANKYWLWWFIIMFSTFLGPEIYSLVVKRPQGTLSETIWRLEKFDPANGMTTWNAFHFLFIGALMVVFIWLICHFGWRLFA